MPRKTKLAGDFKLSIDQHALKKLVFNVKQNYQMIGKKRSGPYKCGKLLQKDIKKKYLLFTKYKKKSKKIEKKSFKIF